MNELVEIAHPAAIDIALREIRAGNVISFPLESGYVLAADAFNRAAVGELLNETGPLAVAGAGLAGRAAFTEPTLVRDVFGANVGVIIDGGAITDVVQSTVVDCTQTPPRVIRVGAVAQASLRQACPEISQDLG